LMELGGEEIFSTGVNDKIPIDAQE
jgi:hypothetical protein